MGSPRLGHSGCGCSSMAGQGSSCASSWPSDPFCRSSWVLWASFLWHPVLLLISGCLSICWIELWLQRELDFCVFQWLQFGVFFGRLWGLFWSPLGVLGPICFPAEASFVSLDVPSGLPLRFLWGPWRSSVPQVSPLHASGVSFCRILMSISLSGSLLVRSICYFWKSLAAALLAMHPSMMNSSKGCCRSRQREESPKLHVPTKEKRAQNYSCFTLGIEWEK